MTYMTVDELNKAILETEVQEKMFRLAGEPMNCAHWVLERVKLRAQLFTLLCQQAGGTIL